MIIYPAVDLKNGECVRLKQGLADQVTVFSKDPVAMAKDWADKGAKWLHIVDLDGAFSGRPVNFDLIRDMCEAIDIPTQLGGGIRDLDIARSYLDAGVTRLIIGTMALAEPDAFGSLCNALPGKIGVSLDAVDGQLKTKGWVEDAGMTIFDVLPRLEEQGAAFIIYTDISRDGMQSGINVASLARLVEKTSLPVIAAGGVATLDDVKNAYPLFKESKGQFNGAITGRAIYEGTLDLVEAMDWINAQG